MRTLNAKQAHHVASDVCGSNFSIINGSEQMVATSADEPSGVKMSRGGIFVADLIQTRKPAQQMALEIEYKITVVRRLPDFAPMIIAATLAPSRII